MLMNTLGPTSEHPPPPECPLYGVLQNGTSGDQLLTSSPISC